MVQDFALHCEAMDRDFDIEVYGTSGMPLLVFPSEGGSCSDWNINGMVDTLRDLIEDGSVQLFCVDAPDASSWLFSEGNPLYRRETAGKYIRFVVDELVPFVCSKTQRPQLFLVGAGTGALNAAIALLWRPELFSGILGLSGIYDARMLVQGIFDEEWAQLSPTDVLNSLDNKRIDALVGQRWAFVSGQGSAGVSTQHELEELCDARKINAYFEYWGDDVTDSWMWRQEMLRQLLPCLLEADGLENRRRAGVLARAQEAARQAQVLHQEAQAALAWAEAWVEQASSRRTEAELRLEAERSQVALCVDRSDSLQAVADALWLKRDEAARMLAEAEAVARAAQDDADTAHQAAADARWIAGEARAEVDAATSEQRDAEEALQQRSDSELRARYAMERADAALSSAEAQAGSSV